MIGKFENIDRHIKEPGLEPIDVLLFTLDEEKYLERCLDSVYREIPVNRVLALDGGSKDKTIEILKKYPRVEIYIRPDIRTTGKGCEFLFSRTTTGWFAIFEAHIDLPAGWYDEMVKHKGEYDFFGCKRIDHYEFERVDSTSIDINTRPMGAPWLAKRECFKNYKVDDDYMWRATDILLRQVAEKNGYKFGKIATTYHYHNTTDNPMYESDADKKGRRLVFTEPKLEILDRTNWEKRQADFRKAVIKYIDPDYLYPHNDITMLETLLKLDPQWVKKTSLKWYHILSDFRKKKTVIKRLKIIAGTLVFLAGAIMNDIKASYKKITEAFK